MGSFPGGRAADRCCSRGVWPGNPDDPQSGCGGTIARYTDEGHEVVILYLTRGESGIERTSMQDAAAIRTAEREFITSEEPFQRFQDQLHVSTQPYFEVLLKTTKLVGTPLSAEVIVYRTFLDRLINTH
ncbi:MAG TPA: PIG-L family deacetylase [Terracidiphilus sp.]|nr:PIG-L family deacetylase [Terracidiphilus sp.]